MTKQITVRVDWVLGHKGGFGNEAAHAWASAEASIHTNPSIAPGPWNEPDRAEGRAAAKQ